MVSQQATLWQWRAQTSREASEDHGEYVDLEREASGGLRSSGTSRALMLLEEDKAMDGEMDGRWNSRGSSDDCEEKEEKGEGLASLS